MINYALVGLADPRHRHLLAPFTRRRAGIRPVAVADPSGEQGRVLDPAVAPVVEAAREELSRIAADAAVPAFTDHTALLAEAMPTLVGVAMPSGAHRVVVDAVDAGAGVLALPPLADTTDELDGLAARISRGAGVTVVHTWRGHQTATVAAELVARGQLGELSGVALTLAGNLTEHEVAAASYEIVDLFALLTGATSGTVRVPVDAAGADDEVLRLEVTGEADGRTVRLEVWQSTEPSPVAVPGFPPLNAYLVQVIGTGGSVEWDVRSGRFASAIGDREPVLLSCGQPDREADWVLSTLVRGSDRPLSGAAALLSTRILLQARASQQSDGISLPW